MTRAAYLQRGLPAHFTLLTLAVPMILANITTPLLGLVDTAVMGHMAVSAPLAGAAIGGLILTQIYWVCGFLRMSATGLSAQARGKQSSEEIAKTFYQTAFVGLAIGLLLLILQQPALWAGLTLTAPSEVVSRFAETYFNVRVWGAPAALSNIALIGWLVGQQKTRAVLFIQVVGNLLNAGLDLLFVWSFGMGVEGVALASVIAEYTMAVMGFCVAIQHVDGVKPVWQWFSRSAQKVLMKLNGDMLLRNLALQGCLAFLTIQGARYGETATAVNAILMQFFVLIALGLDGIAYAVEATVGEAAGANSKQGVVTQTHRGLIWSSVVAIGYALAFYGVGDNIVWMLTDIQALQTAAMPYLPLMVLLPLLAHWCFLFDGVFVGLTKAKSMRNTMIISALVVYFPVWFVLREAGNEALWWALLAFLLARGVTLGGSFYLYYVRAADPG